MVLIYAGIYASISLQHLSRVAFCNQLVERTPPWYLDMSNTGNELQCVTAEVSDKAPAGADDIECMPVEKKRELVVQNKDKGCGKGHRRKIELTDEVKCKDMTRLQQDKPFMTKKQFLGQTICV